MPNKLRVLMVVPGYPPPIAGGLQRQAHELSKALLDLDVDVLVVSDRTEPNQPPMHMVDGVHILRWPTYETTLKRFLLLPFALTKVLFGLRDKVDIIHLHNISWLGAFVIFLAKLMNIPVLVKLPNVGDFGVPGIALGPLGKLRQKLILSADAVVAMSRDSVQELRTARYPENRILRVTNGISFFDHSYTKETRVSRPLYVVFIGRLVPNKGVRDLIAAWREIVNQTRVPINLELWGDGPQKKQLADLVHRSRIDDSVFLRGHVVNIRRKLPAMDIFVLPSYNEGNSNAILEAMEAGLPIVSTDVGGTALLVGRLGEECLYNPGDWKVLSGILLRLINDPQGRLALGNAMRKRVLDYFTIDKIANSYRDAYVRIAAGRRDEMRSISSPLLLEK